MNVLISKKRGGEGWFCGFVEKMMRNMGFDEKWIKLIMSCISVIKYQFKVNGACIDVVMLKRGLGQGDPIFPYIFLICEISPLC
jgi:hypothetical protein